MDWPALLASLGGALVAATGLVALLARLRVRKRQERAKLDEVEGLWRAVEELAARVRRLETEDVIDRYEEGTRVRRKRPSR